MGQRSPGATLRAGNTAANRPTANRNLPYRQLEKERDELGQNFVHAVLEVQQKTGMKNALLQKRVQALNEIAEQKDLQIAEMTAPTQAGQKLQVAHLLQSHARL